MAKTFYNLNLNIEVISQEVVFDTIHVSFQVNQMNESDSFYYIEQTKYIKCIQFLIS